MSTQFSTNYKGNGDGLAAVAEHLLVLFVKENKKWCSRYVKNTSINWLKYNCEVLSHVAFYLFIIIPVGLKHKTKEFPLRMESTD